MLWDSYHGIPTNDRMNQYYENVPITENNQEFHAGSRYSSSSEQEFGSHNKDLIPIFDNTTNEYCCTICSYKHKHKSKIIRHMRYHTGYKPFLCKFCPYRSANSTDLKRHLRVHTGERPFSCEICNKSFSIGSNLSAHMRTHR